MSDGVASRSLSGISLCAGIGGIDLGLELALGGRYRTVAYVERDPHAASCLVARMEDEALGPAPIWDDLKTFPGRDWRGRVDLISAGYPCQPFSCAGGRAGTQDPRHLWPHVRRIISQVRPRYVFLENVRGHLSLGFDRVLSDLARLGFDAEWTTLGASGVGAPHRRQRLFILAWPRLPDSQRDSLRAEQGRAESGRSSAPEPGDLGGNVEHADSSRSEGCRRERQGGGGLAAAAGIDLADADLGRLEGEWSSGLFAREREALRDDVDGRHLWPPGPQGSEAFRSAPASAQPAIRRELDGLPGRLDELFASRADRLRCLGNAVVPIQAAVAFRTLAARVPR